MQYARNTELKGLAIFLMLAVLFVNLNRANVKICLLLYSITNGFVDVVDQNMSAGV